MIQSVEAAGKVIISEVKVQRIQGRPLTETFDTGQYKNDGFDTFYSCSGMQFADTRDS
jgi:hypothetical protein